MMAVIAVISAIPICRDLESMHFSSGYCSFLLAVFKEGVRHSFFFSSWIHLHLTIMFYCTPKFLVIKLKLLHS